MDEVRKQTEVGSKSIKEAKADMLTQFNADIEELETHYPDNPILSATLLDNREALVICGDDDLRLTDLSSNCSTLYNNMLLLNNAKVVLYIISPKCHKNNL